MVQGGQGGAPISSVSSIGSVGSISSLGPCSVGPSPGGRLPGQLPAGLIAKPKVPEVVTLPGTPVNPQLEELKRRTGEPVTVSMGGTMQGVPGGQASPGPGLPPGGPPLPSAGAHLPLGGPPLPPVSP